MTTSKILSNISYNSETFLRKKLTDLVMGGKLQFAAYITHEPDTDSTKTHRHLFLIPDGRVDTSKLFQVLQEPDFFDTSKPPLGVTKIWHTTSETHLGDLLLYDLHDSTYLAAKGLARERLDYPLSDWWSTDPDYLEQLYADIDIASYVRGSLPAFIAAVERGETFINLVKSGLVPMNQYLSYQNLYDRLASTRRPVSRPERSDVVEEDAYRSEALFYAPLEEGERLTPLPFGVLRDRL